MMNADDDAPRAQRRRGWGYPTLAVLLIAAFVVQTVLSARAMSAATDEVIDIAAGYSYWKTRDGRINMEHPPLIKLLLTVPLLPLGLRVPTDDASWQDQYESAFAAAFLYHDLSNAERIVVRARIPIVVIAALLALVVWRWAAALWGPEAGPVALFLFAFDPNIIANSALATLDLGLAAFTFIAMYYVWKWHLTGRPSDALLASATLGFALLTKYAALAFLPLFLAGCVLCDAVVQGRRSPRLFAPLKRFLLLAIGAAVVMVAVYALTFHWRPLFSGSGHGFVAGVVARAPFLPDGLRADIVSLGQHIWVPDVKGYVDGALDQLHHLRDGDPGQYLMGRHSTRGWWYYYPVAFLIKTPLPILLLVLARLLGLRLIRMAAGEYVLLVPIAGIMILACFSTVDLGLRYILPLYPFLFVWLSRVIALVLFGTVGRGYAGAGSWSRYGNSTDPAT
jgi:4-amino-4-deoxy-L-arabinose transferase-like glycosyltransferase